MTFVLSWKHAGDGPSFLVFASVFSMASCLIQQDFCLLQDCINRINSLESMGTFLFIYNSLALGSSFNAHPSCSFRIWIPINLSILVLPITHLSYFCRCYPNSHRFAHPDSSLMTSKKFVCRKFVRMLYNRSVSCILLVSLLSDTVYDRKDPL